MSIGGVMLLRKEGGKSGTFVHPHLPESLEKDDQ